MKMLDELEKKTRSNKKATNLGKQFGTKLLDTNGQRKLLKSGKKVLELKCSPSSLLQSKLTEAKSFVWERKAPGTDKFKAIVGVSGSGKLYWAEKADWPKWIKFNEMLSFQSADGSVGQPASAYLKLYVPMGDCEHETGSFKCKFYGKEKSGVMKLEKYFKLNSKIDPKCTKRSKPSGKAVPNPTKSANAVMDTLEKDVDKVLDTVKPNLSHARPGYFRIVAALQTVVIIILIIVIIIVCCCLRRKRKGGSKTTSSPPSSGTQAAPPSSQPPAQPASQPVQSSAPQEYMGGAPMAPPNDAPPPPGPPPGAPNRGALLGDINKLRIE